MLDLKEGAYVLDVGCGIGGSAFLMKRDYGAKVLGFDLSVNMIDIAQERLAKHGMEADVKFKFKMQPKLNIQTKLLMSSTQEILFYILKTKKNYLLTF